MCTKSFKNKESGFTLVELSLVILIIGLLISSIFAGQSLIRNAQLKAVMSEIRSIETAINSFRDRHGSLPGDFDKADNNFQCPGPNALVPAGCNGDNNGNIDYISTTGYEPARVWQHLALANIISGNFLGGVTVDDMMRSKISNGFYSVFTTPSAQFGRMGTIIVLGAYTGTADSYNALLTPQDARHIDLKIDDGIANKGQVFGQTGIDVSANTCSRHPSHATGVDYNLTTKVPACRLAYWYDIE
jgi:prepilin-type N-terminal cleavage/methylation domain-containing protein